MFFYPTGIFIYNLCISLPVVPDSKSIYTKSIREKYGKMQFYIRKCAAFKQNHTHKLDKIPYRVEHCNFLCPGWHTFNGCE